MFSDSARSDVVTSMCILHFMYILCKLHWSIVFEIVLHLFPINKQINNGKLKCYSTCFLHQVVCFSMPK